MACFHTKVQVCSFRFGKSLDTHDRQAEQRMARQKGYTRALFCCAPSHFAQADRHLPEWCDCEFLPRIFDFQEPVPSRKFLRVGGAFPLPAMGWLRYDRGEDLPPCLDVAAPTGWICDSLSHSLLDLFPQRLPQ